MALSQQEVDQIVELLPRHNNHQISKILGCKPHTVARYRKLHDGKGQTVRKNERKIENAIKLNTIADIPEEELVEFFKTEFANPYDYQILKKQFSKEEIFFYVQEWRSYRKQFDEIFSTEARQIDELIKAQIMSNRILVYINDLEAARLESLKMIEKIKSEGDAYIQDEEERTTMIKEIGHNINMANGAVGMMRKEFNNFAQTKSKILEDLKAKRQQRTDLLDSKNFSFLDLVKSLQDQDVREVEGKRAALAKVAQRKAKKDMRKPIRFEDGEMDAMLLDGEQD